MIAAAAVGAVATRPASSRAAALAVALAVADLPLVRSGRRAHCRKRSCTARHGAGCGPHAGSRCRGSWLRRGRLHAARATFRRQQPTPIPAHMHARCVPDGDGDPGRGNRSDSANRRPSAPVAATPARSSCDREYLLARPSGGEPDQPDRPAAPRTLIPRGAGANNPGGADRRSHLHGSRRVRRTSRPDRTCPTRVGGPVHSYRRCRGRHVAASDNTGLRATRCSSSHRAEHPHRRTRPRRDARSSASAWESSPPQSTTCRPA